MPVDVRQAVQNAQILAINQMVGVIKGRIQREGETSTNQKIGEYSSGYKRIRENNGYQTDHIDLTFTGKMLDSFRSGKGLKEDSIVLGFDDYNIRTSTTKAGKTYTANLVEIYTTASRWTEHGAIFQLSESEIKEYNELFSDFFQNEIKKQRGQ